MNAKKTQFLAILERELKEYPWAQDADRFTKYMEGVRQTLDGQKTCAIDGNAWKVAWKEMNIKGKLTYKALHGIE